jgi:3-oxoacyl-[acyl-carrier protein] reductase
MYESIAGTTVVVTGATRGIGRGMALAFGREGASVLVAGRDDAAGTQVVREISDAGGSAVFVHTDVSRRDSCAEMARRALDAFGRIDVVCANAGVFPGLRLADVDEAHLAEVLDVNVAGTFFSVQACLPALEQSGRGRVILTSSITGPITGFPGWTAYGASKAAQLGFMRSAAIELARARITVNAILPGNIITESLAGLGEDKVASMAAAVPLGRLGTVEEIGYAALFLASAEAGYITGQTLVVDGGQVLPESIEALADPPEPP